jgi:hypothetical protein
MPYDVRILLSKNYVTVKEMTKTLNVLVMVSLSPNLKFKSYSTPPYPDKAILIMY